MVRNERGAGRKSLLTEKQLTTIRQRHARGETITALAQEYDISRQALSKKINAKEKEADIVCRTLLQWKRENQDFQVENLERYRMRLDYMCQEERCTCILVNFQDKEIRIKNETENLLHRAFGIKVKPNWEDFEEFLKERCFPESREGLKLILEQLELDSYETLAIVEKTHGRMAEDLQWIRLRYYTERIVEG